MWKVKTALVTGACINTGVDIVEKFRAVGANIRKAYFPDVDAQANVS